MSNQRCVRFLLGFVLFLVVSLCSFTLSYADTPQGYMTITTNTSSGATNSQTTYPLPFYGSAWGSSDTSNHYVFFSFEPQDNGYLYFETTDSNITVNASLSNIVYDNGNFGVPIITNLGDGLYRLSLDPSTNGAKKVGFSIYLSKVRIAYAFLSVNKHDTLADVLAELQQFHSDVDSSFEDINTALDDIYSILPFTPNDHIKFVLGGAGLSTQTVKITYDKFKSLSAILDEYLIGKAVPLYNSSGYSKDVYYFISYDYDRGDGTSQYRVRTVPTPTSTLFTSSVLYVWVNGAMFSIVWDNESVAVSGLNDGTESLNNQAQQNEVLESQFTGSMTSNFNALNLSQFDFGSDTLSGMAVVGGIMTSIFNSMGKWTVVYTFPLLLAVVLVLIGKISRSDRKGSSKGGDDS